LIKITYNSILQVGSKVISLERAYAITVGSNLGTTSTSILAALATSSDGPLALQLAFCHCIFNVCGILLFYLVPFMRWPLLVAKIFGRRVLKYKWFSIFYLILSFFLIPAIIYGLSNINTFLLYIVICVVCSMFALCILLTYLQSSCPAHLPEKLRDWTFIPKHFRSFEIIDYVVQTNMEVFCCCLVERTVMLSPMRNDEARGGNTLQLGLGANLQLVKVKK
jgi:sodium-dependent phosphate cotransporter